MSNLTAVEIDKFNAAVGELSRVAGRARWDVLASEAEAILRKVITLTPVAKVAGIRARMLPVHQGGTKLWTFYPANTATGKLYNLENKYPTPLWNAINAQIRTRLAEKVVRRGLSRNSWWLMAEKMGISIEVPGYIRKVEVKGVDLRSNVSAIRGTSRTGKATLGGTNAQPTIAGPLRGQSILDRAIRGRVRYFEENLRRGVFADVAQIAKKYPGLTVR